MPTKLAQPAQLAFGAGFGFVTGYANLICIARYSAFGTMMTGNLLMMAKSFVEGGMSAGAGHKIPLPLFFALIIGWRHFGILCYHIAGKTRFRTMTLMGPTILFVIVAAESAWFFLDKHLIPERWNVWFVAFCFGVQSSVTFPAMGVPTMLATGHLTNIWFTYIEVLLGEKPKGDLKKTLYPTINAGSIVIGAAAGAFANIHFKGHAGTCFLLTPITMLQVSLMLLVERMTSDDDSKKDK